MLAVLVRSRAESMSRSWMVLILRVTAVDRSRFGGGWGAFRGFLIMGGTDDGIDTEGVY